MTAEVVTGLTAVVALLAAIIGCRTNAIQLGLARRQVSRASSESVEATSPPSLDDEVGLRLSSRPLPRPPAEFVDRELEIDTAIDRICVEREAVLAFDGERGIGKSAVASRLAARLRTEPPCGPVDLRDHNFVWVDGDNGCTTIAEIGRSLSLATHDHSVAASSPSGKLDRLRAHLAANKTALLLDNLRLSADEESDRLRELLRTIPDGSLVIATVNHPAGLDASRVPVPELGVDDVHRLVGKLVDRWSLEPVAAFDKRFAERLYDIVGGHPQAIWLFLRAYRDGVETLDERLDTLRRGKGLETLFEPVWAVLSDDCRAMLAACDLLDGKATPSQLATACDMSTDQAKQRAQELLGEGLLGLARSTGQVTFTCSRAFRLYAFGETPVHVRYTYLQRLAQHYIVTFEAAPEDAEAAIPEADALRAVFAGLARQPPDGFERPEIEADLQRLFKATLDIFLTLGLFDDRLAAAGHAYESAVRTRDHRCASLAAHVLCGTHAFRGDWDEAEEALALGWGAVAQAGDPAEIARLMYTEGFLRYRSGNPDEALAAVEGAVERAREGGDSETVVNVLDLRSAVLLHLGRIDECEADATRCLEVCEKIGWERAKAFPLRFLAEVAIHRDDSKLARVRLERARGIATGYRDQRQQARVSLTTARMHLLDGRLDAAEPAAEEAVAESRRLGLPPEEEEAQALLDAVRRARSSRQLLDRYRSERPIRLTGAPVAGD